MKKGQMHLYNAIKKELKEGELIYIIRNETRLSQNWDMIMEQFTYDEIFNNYSANEIVMKLWHEDGLCIILK